MTDGASTPLTRRAATRRVALRVAVVAVVLAGALVAAATTGSSPSRVTDRPTQGVGPTSVSVGAIVTQSGPLAADFAPYLDGVVAYLRALNAAGGVDGRRVRLVAALDDMSVPTADLSAARVLVTQDHVFAIVGVASPFFQASRLLGSIGVPTFGYSTADVWSGPPNLFAVGGSTLDEAGVVPDVAYLAHRLGTRRVALLALDVPASQAPCAAMRAGLGAAGVHVAYVNLTIPYVGSALADDVVRMQQQHVGLVVSCMDVNSNVALGHAMRLHGMAVPSLWLDGYDRTALRADAADMARVYLLVQHVPFELGASGRYPGLARYLAAMSRAGFGAVADDDVALDGWESAALFTEGLRRAGRHLSQPALVAALNRVAADTGGGVAPPVDWRTSHARHGSPGTSCVALVTTRGVTGPHPRFALAFGTTADPWTCLEVGGPPGAVQLRRPPPGTPLG